MELVIHDLNNEKLKNLKWKIEKKEKIIDKKRKSKKTKSKELER